MTSVYIHVYKLLCCLVYPQCYEHNLFFVRRYIMIRDYRL